MNTSEMQQEAQKNNGSSKAATAAVENPGRSVENSDAAASKEENASVTTTNQSEDNENENGQVERVDSAPQIGNKDIKPSVPLSDLEKKQRRAERFGVNVVLSEEDKRRLRASRFNAGDKKGVSKAKAGIDAEVSEVEKLNARAARFGTGSYAVANEEAKKKARLERFSGIDSKLEEEKRKARAARFSTGDDEGVKKKMRTDNTATVATAAKV